MNVKRAKTGHRRRFLAVVVAAVLLAAGGLGGCRADAGDPDYESQEQFDFGGPDADAGGDGGEDGGGNVPLPGPDPWEPGENRLSIGVFYEGGASQTIEVNDVTTHVYLYEGTVTLDIDGERLEGLVSHRLVHAGAAWWGMGVHWDETRDLSGWGTMHVSFRSSDPGFDVITVGMNGAADDRHAVAASDYGYVNDGEWHTLAIPLADFEAAGLDLTAVTSPLSLGGDGAAAGEVARIDDVYFTAE